MRKINIKGGESMTKNKMNSKAARRIQSNVDKSGKNQSFKARAQRAASINERK